MSQYKVITIDGPAGSGKSTAARMLAQRIGWRKLDTGAIYRTLALLAKRTNTNPEDEQALANLARNLPISFDGERVLLNGEDVTEQIRTPEISELASKVSAHALVRKALLPIQRQLASQTPSVAEGRDTGTVVFPDAQLKFFLTASLEERARRRQKELKQKGMNLPLEEVMQQERERDLRDSTRAVAPLRKPDDAIVIDSTNLTIEEMVELMQRHVEEAGLA